MRWTLDSLSGAEERFIVANRAYPEFELPVCPDTFDVQTPLSGLHAALEKASQDWVAVAACDLPFLTPLYWQKLCAFRDNAQAVVVARAGRLEPLAALYHRNTRFMAEKRLVRGEPAVYAFIEAIDVCIIDWTTLGLTEQTLTNVNRVRDLYTS